MGNESQQIEFLKHIHEEKLRTLEARTTYTIQKLAFVTGLLGLGSLNIKVGNIDFGLLVYLTPWVAIAFDFYIMGEDYSVKRIGAFLGVKSSEHLEKQWEQWVAKNRDPFGPWAMPILTTLIFIGSAIIASQQPGAAQSPFFAVWLLASGAPSWLSFIFYYRLRRRVLMNVSNTDEQQPPLQQSIAAVDNTGHQLTTSTYRGICQFFTNCLSNPSYLREIRQLAKEYGEQEFLLCVDPNGKPVPIDEPVLEDFREMAMRYPEYGLWFREATLPKGEKPTLLIARWLCHLVGVRHMAVHLFIDHPNLMDHTLLQVRAIGKAESPGCFDLPAAGHVIGTESVETTLHKELGEELGLKVDALRDFARLGSYEYRQISDPSNFRNVEYRTVFYGRLNDDDWLRVSATDHEVAAIAAFSIVELQEMLVSFPERIASGLKASFPLYLKSKLKAQN